MVVFVNTRAEIFPDPLVVPVTFDVLSLVQAKVVPAMLLLVPSAIGVGSAIPEHTVWLAPPVNIAIGAGLTVAVIV